MSQRTFSNIIAATIPLLSIMWALQLPIVFGLEIARVQFLAVLLGFGCSLVYLTRSAETSIHKYLFYLLAGLAFAIFGWISIHYQRFQMDFPYLTVEMQILGSMAALLVLDAIRRTTGWVLISVIAIFFAYALFGEFIPDPLTGTNSSWQEIAVYLAFDPNAILGTPLAVIASIVVVFIFFGKLLVLTGCGEFFIDLAMAAMGKKRGSAAKTSIVGSALFGSISGSAVSNVVTTGVMTIPLMRRSGYSGVQSGAIEAIASTGGQLMPPIMGAAAFLMAQTLEIPYSEVVLAALIPALLYYISLFIQVDLIAARDNIVPSQSILKSVSEVLKEGWHFAIPFIVLMYAMFINNASAQLAALYGSISIVILGSLRSYQGHRLELKKLIESFPETGIAVKDLIMIVAGAGIVIGLLNISSGGFALTLTLVQLGASHISILLLVSAAVCILLGMGMPTTGVYVLLAALVAPALIETGIEPLAAHMFILYFGMMSMITPPIALAAFSAATITESKPMKTGFEAMKLGWLAYVVPLMFIFTPALTMNSNPVDIVLTFALSIFGVLLISVAVVGYFSKSLSLAQRLLFLLLGILIIMPRSWIDLNFLPSIVALAIGALLLFRLYKSSPTKNVAI
ncbi:TRAP transporter fused permease subunit [Alginatibacterium sediminis]|uniref:TRAP transporter fused permease subunit n=1 Tax=Alginatibacterium sediminis TaxID=2164068 RepID=A0A420E7F4_9ALTE|nr:TRAP transporter fused permease subunit [Alginatibacterium sediminis]RKF14358.1 TRAP transporter fused permease subunit [Alginatibacterium sediminis]